MTIAMANWKEETYSLGYLKKMAYDQSHIEGALAWLLYIGVIPAGTDWKRGNAAPRTGVDRNAIPAGYLAEVAYDWDKDGRTTPLEFIRAFEVEVGDG